MSWLSMHCLNNNKKKNSGEKNREDILKRSESSDLKFFSSIFYASICLLNGIFWETLQSNSESELQTTGSFDDLVENKLAFM